MPIPRKLELKPGQIEPGKAGLLIYVLDHVKRILKMEAERHSTEERRESLAIAHAMVVGLIVDLRIFMEAGEAPPPPLKKGLTSPVTRDIKKMTVMAPSLNRRSVMKTNRMATDIKRRVEEAIDKAHKFSRGELGDDVDRDIAGDRVGRWAWGHRQASRLPIACESGDIRAARAALKDREGTINRSFQPCPGDVPVRPLQIAAANGRTAMVRFLIEAGADVNSECYDDPTPLIAAAMEGHAGTVQALLDSGARIRTVASMPDGHRGTALYAAKLYRDIAVKRAAETSERSRYGKTITALQRAKDAQREREGAAR